MGIRSVVGIGSAACLAALMASFARAQDEAFVANPVISAGLTYGGDTLASYDVHWGDVDAGGTLYYYGGINLEWPRRHLALIAQGGRFVTSVSDYEFESLGDFERWPLELVVFFENKHWRGGIGAVRHLSPTFRDKGENGFKVDLDDASGSLVELEYLFPRFSLNARYVLVDYETASDEISGDHLGAGFTWRFGQRKVLR